MVHSATPLRAAVYGRESRSNSESIDGQVELGVELVSDRGWLLVDTYDDGGSASRFARKPRPNWDRLVRDLEAGLIDVVILNEVSRGDRKPRELLTVLDICRDRGIFVHVISDDRTYDPQKSSDYHQLAGAGLKAAEESDRTSERVTRGVVRAAKKGHPPMGPTPYGYTRTRHAERDADGKLKTVVEQFPDPATAHIPREIIEKIARSVPVNQIQRDLLAEHGLDWERSGILVVARNVAYIGKRVHRRQGRRGDRKRPEIFDGNWEPIVLEEVFWAAQRVLDEPSRQTWPQGPRPGSQRHLLSFLAVCHRTHPVQVRRDRFYRCSKGCAQVVKDDLDEYITTAVLETLKESAVYGRLRVAGQTSDAEVQAAQNEAAALRARLNGYRQRARTGTIDADDFAEISTGLRADIAAAENRAARAGLPPALRPFLEPGVDVEERWYDPSTTLQAKREVIAALYTVTVRPVGRRKRVPVAERVDIVSRIPGVEGGHAGV